MLLLPMCASASLPAADDSLEILFTGDIMLGRDVARVVRHSGADALFTPSIDSLFASADAVVANLECPATDIESPLNKRFVFRASPDVLPVLRRHGVTHLNLANNHSIDQGRRGLTDTYRNILYAGMTPLGYGENAAEAARPQLLAVSPRPVYMLSSLLVMSENYVSMASRPGVCESSVGVMCDTIAAIRRRCPTACIIVSLHWGTEHTLHPTLLQRADAHRLIDAGADAIIGHHSHTAQDVETYRGRPIFYSLGNFIFDLDRPLNRRAIVARLIVTPTVLRFAAIPIEINRCRPNVSENGQRKAEENITATASGMLHGPCNSATRGM